MTAAPGIAIIGTGWGVRVQVPAFRAAGWEVIALAGSDQAKTERIAAEQAVPHAFSDWRMVLDAPGVALVSIVTPPHLHLEMSRAALAAGKHVLCEKPTALDLAEAQGMLAASSMHPGLLNLIDHELRFLPMMIQARQQIADGLIGQVRYVLGVLFNSGRSDPSRAWNWWSDAAQGGGLLGAVGSHQIDTVRYLLSAEVETVSAALHTFITHRPDANGQPTPVTTDDYYGLRLRYSSGALVTLEGNVTNRTNDPDSLTFYGTEGTLRISSGTLKHAPAGGEFTDITPPDSVDIPDSIRAGGPFPVGTVYLAHALRAYLAGDGQAAAPGATFLDGARIQAALDAARQSAAQQGVAVAPVQV